MIFPILELFCWFYEMIRPEKALFLPNLFWINLCWPRQEAILWKELHPQIESKYIKKIINRFSTSFPFVLNPHHKQTTPLLALRKLKRKSAFSINSLEIFYCNLNCLKDISCIQPWRRWQSWGSSIESGSINFIFLEKWKKHVC